MLVREFRETVLPGGPQNDLDEQINKFMKEKRVSILQIHYFSVDGTFYFNSFERRYIQSRALVEYQEPKEKGKPQDLKGMF